MIPAAAVGPLIGAAGSLLGGALGGHSTRSASRRNAESQREFAQMGVRWKVEDAKAAGIHPLYALGAQTHSFTPSYVGDTSTGAGLAAAGQDLSRAFAATRSSDERGDALGNFMIQKARESDARLQTIEHQHRVQGMALQNDNLMLENEMRRLQLRRLLGQVGPGLPGAAGGGGGSVGPVGAVKVEPSQVTSRNPSDSSVEAGTTPMLKEYEFAPGWGVQLLGEKAAESLESEVLAAAVGLPTLIGANLPHLGGQAFRKLSAMRLGPPKALGPPRKGYEWVYRPISDSWQEVKK